MKVSAHPDAALRRWCRFAYQAPIDKLAV